MIKRLATYLWRHHLALLALFVVLGGTSYAAVNALPKNSVGSKQVINGSLQTLDLSKKARAALKGNRGPRGFAGAQGAPGAKGATGAQGVQGIQGVQGPPGSTVGYALITSGGAVDTTQSSGVTDAMVTHANTGVYCITAPPAGSKTAVVTVSTRGVGFGSTDQFASVDLSLGSAPNYSGCANGTDRVRITVWDASAAALANSYVYIWFED
jgi:Collagen triple helix repeat (20 copies)